MNGEDLLCEGVRALARSAKEIAATRGLGVVRRLAPGRVELIAVDDFGASAYECRERDVPEAFRPRTDGMRFLTADELAADPDGLVATRLLHSSMSDEIRAQHGVRQVVTLAAPGTGGAAILFVGLGDPRALEPAQASHYESLAARVADFVKPLDTSRGELELLRRLEAAERLLPSLCRVLDVREIFERLSDITRDVLRHDFASLGVLSDDLLQVDLYVQTSPNSYRQGGPMPFPPVQTRTWQYRFVDDLTINPLERDLESAKAGGRTSLRVAVRFDDQVLGALNFTSRETRPYDASDLIVARRIADYVALGLSHFRTAQRLAEEARRNEELSARATKSDLLDEVLSALAGSGELPKVFDRISQLTQKVLAHDALILPVRLPDGRHAKVYASSTGEHVRFPDVIDVPPSLVDKPDWEFEVVADLQAEPDQRHLWTTQQGYRATLRVPIRLDNEFVGGLSFLSFTPGVYTQADVPVARRIADRVALNFAPMRASVLMKRADEATERAARLEARVQALTEELDARTGYRRVVGESKPWREALTQATQVAPTEATVLLLGESGTGKEVVARYVHRASPRAKGPFVALNCATLPDALLESELFGYEKGAFTGATSAKAGQLELAAGGTLFLDEVAEMSPAVQAKFLRVLQEREFKRLGGTSLLRADARVVAATNRDLERAIAQGRFREDLYYRINVFAIRLPPLRERRDDILPLCEAFLGEIGRGLGYPPAGISQDARTLLTEYHWPGNARELRNIVERAAILCEGGLITAGHLALKPMPRTVASVREPAPRAEPAPVAAGAPAHPSSASDLQSIERTMIEEALRTARFNKSKAAKALGMTRQQLYLRLRKYGLE